MLQHLLRPCLSLLLLLLLLPCASRAQSLAIPATWKMGVFSSHVGRAGGDDGAGLLVQNTTSHFARDERIALAQGAISDLVVVGYPKGWMARSVNASVVDRERCAHALVDVELRRGRCSGRCADALRNRAEGPPGGGEDEYGLRHRRAGRAAQRLYLVGWSNGFESTPSQR